MSENDPISGARNAVTRSDTLSPVVIFAYLEAMVKEYDKLAAERDAANARLAAVLKLCDENEALSRRIWDEMEDYADIGHPKGPWPGNAQMPVNAVRHALGASVDAPKDQQPPGVTNEPRTYVSGRPLEELR